MLVLDVNKLAMESIFAVRGMLPAMGIGNLVVAVIVSVSVAVGTGYCRRIPLLLNLLSRALLMG